MTNRLPPGLYRRPINREIDEEVLALGAFAETGPLDVDSATVLARHVSAVLKRSLEKTQDVREQIAVVNRILENLSTIDMISRPDELLAVHRDDGSLVQPAKLSRPTTALDQDALLVNAPLEPNLASELRHEIASADRIDLLCAFIVWSGLVAVRDELEAAHARGVPIRVITTAYMGTTEPRALEELQRMGADVRVSYDARGTRLHAKAWLFHRESGFSTAYVGSSNLSYSAIHFGLEWNVRLAEAASPALVNRFRAAFDSYWADSGFQPYERQQFLDAIGAERASKPGLAPLFDIRPYPYQEEMLQRLDVERKRFGRMRNLLVAATGTGKTVVSAFDYQRLRDGWDPPARLLFVAHRHELLEQSLATFRNVLHNGAFGELWAAGQRPLRGDHVFASVQSLQAVDLSRVRPDYYDMVVIDEFHHAAAPTYVRLLEHFSPRVLLGMTATPERTDEVDITRWFDGRVAFEMRLWEALDEGLLCPFQYLGVADGTDLTSLEWRNGGYDQSSLSNLYTGNDIRLGKVVEALNRWVADPSRMRCLGFCVSVDHAKWMAQRFSALGIPAVAVHGGTPTEERDEAVRKLREGSIKAIFSRDVFNEGLDIPEIDTVLFLRPTESATVYLQQLGRGLRKWPSKAGLTVLDFIGQQHRRFGFATRLTALTGRSRAQLVKDIPLDFPYLPAGCTIRLDPVAQEIVLANVRSTLRGRAADLAGDLRALGDATLEVFLRESERTLEEVYAAGGWTHIRRLAAFEKRPIDTAEGSLQKAIGRMRHIDDLERIDRYGRWLQPGMPPHIDGLSTRERRLAEMLHVDLWGQRSPLVDLPSSLSALWRNAPIREELIQLLELLGRDATTLGISAGIPADIPLFVHERYTRDEILAAIGEAEAGRGAEWREGVRYVKRLQADIFAFTLEKSERRFSPSTMYHDYALSPTLFHWESQSTTSADSPTGRRYRNHVTMGSSVWLFVRESNERGGVTMPFVFAGPATYVSHTGSRPMAITWRLDHPLPAELYLVARAAV
jgi:superfamily II DNA or RNA helicase/HKD family nuclease